MSIATISPRKLAETLEQGSAKLIDVRTPAEFREVRAAPARNIPLDRLDLGAFRRDSSPVYVICKSGSRSARACERLSAAGIDVVSVEGGTDAWAAAGLPVVRGRRTVSLERQVRIAAGSLVLLGVALSLLIHPYLIAVSAFVGAGLVFSGVTDTCGMGMLLARMPWNQVRPGTEPPVACASR